MKNTEELKTAICILNPDEVYNLRNNHPSDGYYCITPYEALELQKSGIEFPSEPHIQEGLVLIRNTNNDGYYYRTEETDARIINERCLAIEAILSYLGGKEFRYSETSSFRSDVSNSINAEASVKKATWSAEASAEDKKTESQETVGKKSASAKWGGHYTHKGYLRATELAKENGLLNDPTIAMLLEQRTPDHPNPIEEQEYHVAITADLDQNLHTLSDLTFGLKGLVGVDLKVDIKSSRKVGQASTVDFYVSFAPIPQEEKEVYIKEEEQKQKEERLALEEQKKNASGKKQWIWWLAAAVVVAVGGLIAVL